MSYYNYTENSRKPVREDGDEELLVDGLLLKVLGLVQGFRVGILTMGFIMWFYGKETFYSLWESFNVGAVVFHKRLRGIL